MREMELNDGASSSQSLSGRDTEPLTELKSIVKFNSLPWTVIGIIGRKRNNEKHLNLLLLRIFRSIAAL